MSVYICRKKSICPKDQKLADEISQSNINTIKNLIKERITFIPDMMLPLSEQNSADFILNVSTTPGNSPHAGVLANDNKAHII